MKSKLTEIFLQNWWLQLHKLIQFHVVSHTLNVPPLLLLGKHRCDNLARTRLSAAYPAWPSWQLQRCVPAAHPRLRVVGVHRLCPSRTPKGKSHKWSGSVISGATCRTPGHFVQRSESICLVSARWETCRQQDAITAAPHLTEKGSHVSQQLVVESTSWLAFPGTSRGVFVFNLY